ncbi:MAG: AAA family ATPase [Candidatus Marsarchaeota archaeon]|jgi:SpoVK/Ycf46/Vps4 family AAA+-type ATPase|nr:AAA family ATPase [Candidatus Marsarchaeota archaeon]
MYVPKDNPSDNKKDLKPEKKPVDPLAKEHWRKGNTLFESKDYDGAITEFTAAINIDKKYGDAYFNRALTYRMKEEYGLAKKDLDLIMELEPKSADAPLLIGDISEANNDLVGARFWYEKALANNPDYTEAKNRLEKIDMMIHIDSTYTKNKKTNELQVEKFDYTETKIEEGQIKQVAFYKSKQKLDDVIGVSKLKKYLRENLVLAIKEPQLFKKWGKDLGLGTILYGPPGVGKTYTVNGIAGESNANVILAVPNQIVDMYTGNTEKNLHMIFETARKHTPCIIFFDELDALGIKRGGGEGGESSALRLAVNQFLMEMSGTDSAKNEGVYIIGATNTPWDIDSALKRSGRFGDHIYVAPPSNRDRKELFEFYTRNKLRSHINYRRLARATMGYSPADIKRITDKAVMRPLLHEYLFHKEKRLTTKDIIAVLKDKDFGGSSLDEWYNMVKKDIISKVETQIVDGKKQEIVKEGKLDAEEKIIYKKMIKDIKKNTSPFWYFIKKFIRWWAINIF